jgi:hypothetical protein
MTTPPPERPRPSPREIDDIFGEVLPSTTSDERDPSSTSSTPDEWYEQNRPPHHDRDD